MCVCVYGCVCGVCVCGWVGVGGCRCVGVGVGVWVWVCISVYKAAFQTSFFGALIREPWLKGKAQYSWPPH
jgi:hypothetical protein